MSDTEFKQHIARIMRERETGKKFSIIGAAPSKPNVVITEESKQHENSE